MVTTDKLQINQTIFMLTEDVSGVSAIPCTVTRILPDRVLAGSITGVEVMVDRATASDFYLSLDEAEAVIEKTGRKHSCWM